MSRVEIIPFNRVHLVELQEQDATRHLSIPESVLDQLEADPWSVTVRVAGRTLLCGGVRRLTEWMGEAWAVLDRAAGPSMRTLHRVAQQVLDACPLPRIQAVTDLEFKPARKWMRMLNFQMESPRMRGYHGPGRDCALYSRIR